MTRSFFHSIIFMVMVSSISFSTTSWASYDLNKSTEAVIQQPANINIIIRKLLERTPEGNYLVQDFYVSGEKLTDPYLLRTNKSLTEFNLYSIDYTAFDQVFLEGYKEFQVGGLTSVGQVLDNNEASKQNGYDPLDIIGKLTVYYKNGKKRGEQFYEEGLKDGPSIWWYESGSKERQATYKKDNLDGAFVVWYKNGKPRLQAAYSNNKLDGAYTFYNEAGKVVKEATYKQGKLAGKYADYYEDGQLFFTTDYTDPNRLVKNWYRKGYLTNEVQYKNGKPFSNKYFDSGILIAEDNFKEGTAELVERYFMTRKVLEETDDGFLVQDFYSNGKKRTDPFILTHEDDLKRISMDYAELSVKGSVKVWHADGLPIYEIAYLDGKRNGVSKIWADKHLLREGVYENDDEQGIAIDYYADGNKWSEMEYKDGQLIKVTAWYQDGPKMLENIYQSDQLVQSIFWYKNGQLMGHNHYKDGLLEGERQLWYENGQLKFTGNYQAGQLVGEVNAWYENGHKKLVGIYEDAEALVTLWSADGQYRTVIKSIDNDEFLHLYNNSQWKGDQKLVENQYLGNTLDGPSREWHENGLLAVTGQYKDNLKNGLWVYYNDKGFKQMEGEFKKGKQTGLWYYWDKEGNKTSQDKTE